LPKRGEERPSGREAPVEKNLSMPAEFPSEDCEAFKERVMLYQNDHPGTLGEFTAAMLAVEYRFKAASEYDEAFTASVSMPGGDAPESIERYRQERNLFGFFANGLSVIECACYAFYDVGKALQSSIFSAELWEINPNLTKDAFQRAYGSERLTACLRTLVKSPVYKGWQRARNILVHRAAPGRVISLGASRSTEWKIDGTPFDAEMTSSRMKWLTKTVQDLIAAARSFANDRLRPASDSRPPE
jgi:hypothetical protein